MPQCPCMTSAAGEENRHDETQTAPTRPSVNA